jgi:hypothetical protein
MRRLGVYAVSIALLAAPLACVDFTEGVAPLPPPRVGTGGVGGGGTSLSAAVVGQWSRTVFSLTPSGEQLTEQTIWEFRPDGTATRTVITTNLSRSTSFATVASGQWQTTGSVLVVTLQLPAGATVSFVFQVTGTTLSLDGSAFTRIG